MRGIVWMTNSVGDIVSEDGDYLIEYCGGRWEAVHVASETLHEGTLEECIDACKQHYHGAVK